MAELAYLAGVIDSDGSIFVLVARPGPAPRLPHRSKVPSFQPVVQIKQVQSEAVELAAEVFGGCIFSDAPSSANGRWLNNWSAACRRAAACLEAVRPYLRIKPAQADNALAVAAINSQRARRTFTADETTELLTPGDAAERYGLPDACLIYNAVRLGMPARRTPKGRMLVRAGHTEQLLLQRGNTPRPPHVTEELWRRYALAKELNRVGRLVREDQG